MRLLLSWQRLPARTRISPSQKSPLQLPISTATEIKEVVDGKKVTVYDEVEKQVTKDAPSRLHARRQILRYLYPVVEVPQEAKGRKKATKKVDLVDKMFTEYGPKYAGRNGGYTRIIKIGQRRGDGAMEVVLEFV